MSHKRVRMFFFFPLFSYSSRNRAQGIQSLAKIIVYGIALLEIASFNGSRVDCDASITHTKPNDRVFT